MIRKYIKSNYERNQNHEKILSVFIAILLTLCLGTTVFAEEVDEAGGSASTDVKATYASGGSADIVYSVDVSWGSMEFTYNDASPGTWNPETHAYDGAGEASWTCDADANKITVTNHSNTAIKATLSFAKKAGFEGIDGSFSKSIINLATAVGTLQADAPTDSSLLTLSNPLSSGVSSPDRDRLSHRYHNRSCPGLNLITQSS